MANNVYSSVAKSILDEFILSGKIKPGNRLPSVRELQDHYSIGRSTIWHALGVLETQQHVSKKRGSGCYVNARPAGGPAQVSKVIGVIGDSGEGPLCYHLQRGVDWVCEKHGYQILVANTHNDYETEQQQVALMIRNGCAGIVISPAPRTRAQLENDYLKTKFKDTPMVLVDIAYAEQQRARVIFDNYQAGYDMTEALIKEGHERIAIMVNPDDCMLKSSHKRYLGYCDAMKAAGLTARPEDKYVTPLFVSMSRLENMLQDWQSADEKWTAIIALHDGIAVSLVNIAEELGIQLPEDLVVAGFDNYMEIHSLKYAIPTTAPDFFQAGRVAARLTIDQISTGEPDASTYILPVPIKKRGLGSLRQTKSK